MNDASLVQAVIVFIFFFVATQLLLNALFRKKRPAPVKLTVLLKSEHEAHQGPVQAVINRTLDQFGMDGTASEDSKRRQFDIIQRNLVMRLRYADAPGDILIRWTMWDGGIVEYQLKEAVI